MYIYKITNKINNKIYIGLVYNKTIYDRFKRHCKEANPHNPILVDRAIYKYGKENFVVEQIDEASSLKELNEKEIYWIKYFNSTNRLIGYNLTNGGDGGNTYLCKSEEELKKIKKKISISNSGKNNGMSKQIKGLNTITNEIIHFDTLQEALNFFKIKNKGLIIDRCTNKEKYLYKGWNFAFEQDEFIDKTVRPKRSHYGCSKCNLINKETNERYEFSSLLKARTYANIKERQLENDIWKIEVNV